MKLSRETRYAVAGLSYLATLPTGTVTDAAGVAARTGLPPAFLAKIFHKLTMRGILVSHPGRGYGLARSPHEISAAEILRAIEGPDIFERCIFWSDTCSDASPCPLHSSWKHVRPQMTGAMESKTLADMAKTPDRQFHPT